LKSSKQSCLISLCLFLHTIFLLAIIPIVFVTFLNVFKHTQSDTNKEAAELVTKSFVFIEIINEERTKTCFGDTCGESTDNRVMYTASGVAIAENQVLTAGHVCQSFEEVSLLFKKEPTKNEYESMTIETQTVIWLIAKDSLGNRLSTRILKIDDQSDLCILDAPGITKELSIKISKTGPLQGDHVLTAAAPLGIFSKGMTLVFDGLYAGSTDDSDVYAMPCRHGSSGAPIVNEDGELVALTYAGSEDIENVNIATNLVRIRGFLHLDK